MASKLIFIPILIVVIIVIVIIVFLFSTICSIIEGIIGKKNANIIGAIFELIYVSLNWLFVTCVFWYSKFHKNVILPFVKLITPFCNAVWTNVIEPFCFIIYFIIYFIYCIFYIIILIIQSIA